MLCLIVELVMLFWGGYVLIAGRFKLSRFDLEGWRARVAGLIMLSPLPVAFVAGFWMALLGIIRTQGTSTAAVCEALIVLTALLATTIFVTTAQENVDRKRTVSSAPQHKRCAQCGADNLKIARHCINCGATFYDDQVMIEQAATNALKPFDELQTMESFVQAVSGQEPPVRQKIAEMIRDRDDRWTVDLLGQLALDPDKNVRLTTVRALAQLGHSQTIDGLLHALEDQNVIVRRAVMEGLKPWAFPQMVDPLIRKLADTDISIKVEAAKHLGRLGDARAVDPLFGLLADPKAQVRKEAIASLSQLCDAETQPLLEALTDLENDRVETRVQAATLVGTLNDQRAVDMLYMVLARWETASVKQAAVRALINRGIDTIPLLLEELKDQNSLWAATTLEEIGPDAVAQLLDALENQPTDAVKSVRARAHIISILGQIGDKRAVPVLINVMENDRYASTKDEAAKTLGLLGDRRATPALIKVLETTTPFQTQLKRIVVTSLIQLNDPEAIDPLTKLLETDNREYALQALDGLKKQSQPGH